MIDAVFLPFEVAFQDEFGVADTVCLRPGDVELVGQFLPVIDPGQEEAMLIFV